MNILKKHGLKLSFGTLLLLILGGVFSLIFLVIISMGFAASIMDDPFSPMIAGDPLMDPNLPDGLPMMFSDEFQPYLLNFITFMLAFFLVYFLISSFISIGLTSSVYEAVFHNRSEVGLPVERGFNLLWKGFKLYLALFLVFLPFTIISVLLDQYLPKDMLMVNLFLQIIIVLIQAAFQSFVLLIAIDQNLTTWKAIKAGFICFQKQFGSTLLTTIFAILSFVVLLLLTGLLIFVLGLSMTSSGPEAEILLFVIAFLLLLIVLPVAFVIFQLILTTRYKNNIRPILYPEPTPAFTTPFQTE